MTQIHLLIWHNKWQPWHRRCKGTARNRDSGITIRCELVNSHTGDCAIFAIGTWRVIRWSTMWISI